MADLAEYGWMIGFKSRATAYARALEANITDGSIVLDIGTGSGIMAFLACRAGATKIYAVEPLDIIQLARECARDNGFSDRIDFIQGFSTDLTLPEKVDGIVAEIHGLLPLHRKSLISLLDARQRLLKPGGWIIPSRDTIRASLACCPDLYGDRVDGWKAGDGIDFTRARAMTLNRFSACKLKPENLVSEPLIWAVLDYQQISDPNISGELSWRIERDVTIHGFCAWYDCETSAGTGFSSSPDVDEPWSYVQAFFPLPEPQALTVGDTVEISLEARFVSGDYVWVWNTVIRAAAGIEKARFNQSTFLAQPLSAERLRKRASGFVPSPNQKWAIDYKIMELIGKGINLKSIAEVLTAEFADEFTNWSAALRRVEDLSEKYSK